MKPWMAVGTKNPNPIPPSLRAASCELRRAVSMSGSDRTSSMSPNTAANSGEAIPNPIEAIMPMRINGSSGLRVVRS